MPSEIETGSFSLMSSKHRNVAIIASAEIEGRIIAHQNPEPLQRRLIEAVLLFQLLDEFRIEALRAAIARGDVAAGLRCAGADLAPAAAEPSGRALVNALQLRNRPLDRAAGHELHDREGNGHDAEDRRDHQQQPAQDVGEHVPSAFGSRQSAVGSRAREQITGIAFFAKPRRLAGEGTRRPTADSRPPLRASQRGREIAVRDQSSSPSLRPTTRCPGAPVPSFGWRSGLEKASQ